MRIDRSATPTRLTASDRIRLADAPAPRAAGNAWPLVRNAFIVLAVLIFVVEIAKVIA